MLTMSPFYAPNLAENFALEGTRATRNALNHAASVLLI